MVHRGGARGQGLDGRGDRGARVNAGGGAAERVIEAIGAVAGPAERGVGRHAGIPARVARVQVGEKARLAGRLRRGLVAQLDVVDAVIARRVGAVDAYFLAVRVAVGRLVHVGERPRASAPSDLVGA